MKSIASQLTISEFFPFFKRPTAKQKFTWNKFSTLPIYAQICVENFFSSATIEWRSIRMASTGIIEFKIAHFQIVCSAGLSKQTDWVNFPVPFVDLNNNKKKDEMTSFFAKNCSNWSRTWDDAEFSKVKFNDGIVSKKQVSNCKKEIDYEIVFRQNCNYVSPVINSPDCSMLRQLTCLEPFCFIENSCSSRMPKAPYSVRVSCLPRNAPLVCLSSSWFIF